MRLVLPVARDPRVRRRGDRQRVRKGLNYTTALCVCVYGRVFARPPCVCWLFHAHVALVDISCHPDEYVFGTCCA